SEISTFVRLGDRLVHDIDQIPIFAANVNVAGMRIDRESGDKHALDQLVWIIFDQHPVLAGARLALVAVDNDVLRLGGIARDEAPLHPGWETSAAAPA